MDGVNKEDQHTRRNAVIYVTVDEHESRLRQRVGCTDYKAHRTPTFLTLPLCQPSHILCLYRVQTPSFSSYTHVSSALNIDQNTLPS